MNWKFWEKSTPHTPVEVKGVLGTSDELGAFLINGLGGTGGTAASAMRLYERSTAVSIPINMIAEDIAAFEPVITDGKTIIRDHEILEFLKTPSPFFTQDLFLETITKNYLITGEYFSVALGNINRPPLELQPITPKDISDVEGVGGVPASFIVSGNTMPGNYKGAMDKRRYRFIDGGLRELMQVRNFSTKNNSLMRGQSLLMAASAEARQHIKGNTHNISLLDNGGRLSLVFHNAEDLTPEDFELFKERVDEQYGGSTKAGAIGVTAGGSLEIKEFGVNNKDMDFVNLQRESKVAVAQQYKIPLALIASDSMTFDNYKQSRLALYDNATLPTATRVFSGLSNLLMSRWGIDPNKMWITYDIDQITPLIERRNEQLKTRKEIGIESTDELREFAGKEPVEGGKEILIPANLVPLSSNSLLDDTLDVPVVPVVDVVEEDGEPE